MEPFIAQAAEILAGGLRQASRLSPRAQAELAHHATGPSVDELEQRIIALRSGR